MNITVIPGIEKEELQFIYKLFPKIYITQDLMCRYNVYFYNNTILLYIIIAAYNMVRKRKYTTHAVRCPRRRQDEYPIYHFLINAFPWIFCSFENLVFVV